jgi:hypothetical protein
LFESVFTFLEYGLTFLEYGLKFCESVLMFFEYGLKFCESVLMFFEYGLIFFESVLKFDESKGGIEESESTDFGRKRTKTAGVARSQTSLIPGGTIPHRAARNLREVFYDRDSDPTGSRRPARDGAACREAKDCIGPVRSGIAAK